MNKEKLKDLRFIIVFIAIVSFSFIYLFQTSYAKYRKQIEGETSLTIAKWNIKVNNEYVDNKAVLEEEITPTFTGNERKNIMIRSVLLALFVLGVNIYAWFIYFTEAQVNITGNVVSWDVSFRDENSQVVEKEIIADINMYPGMPDYSKTLRILNASELPAKFSYEIEEMTLMGEDIKAAMTTEQLETELRESYPFVVNFISDKDSMNIDEEMSFTFDVAWPFDNTEGENNYYDWIL